MAVHEAGHVLARLLLGVGELTAVTIDTATGVSPSRRPRRSSSIAKNAASYFVVMMAGRVHVLVFVVYPGFELLDVSGSTSVFNSANGRWRSAKREPFYKIARISTDGGAVASSSGIAVETLAVTALQQEEVATPLVAGAEREPLLEAVWDPVLGTAISSQRRAVRLGLYRRLPTCLARSARHIHIHEVATHWDSCEPLTRTFPYVTVNPDALYVVDGRVWTSAWVTTGIDTALAMVAHDLEAAIASEVAKRLILYARRPGYQSQSSPVLQAQVKGESPFGELIAWIQANLDQPHYVSSLAARSGMTERTFHRHFAAATGTTPARFVEIARLDAGRIRLSRGRSLKSVAAQVGHFRPRA